MYWKKTALKRNPNYCHGKSIWKIKRGGGICDGKSAQFLPAWMWMRAYRTAFMTWQRKINWRFCWYTTTQKAFLNEFFRKAWSKVLLTISTVRYFSTGIEAPAKSTGHFFKNTLGYFFKNALIIKNKVPIFAVLK